MKYNTSIITYFVIPSGATSGQRIVFDGVLGEIDLYNSANQLVGQWKPGQFGIFAGSPNVGQSITILPNASDDVNRATIEFRQAAGAIFAAINGTDDGAGGVVLNAFSSSYSNAGQVVTTSTQLRTGTAEMLIVASDATRRGGSVLISATQVKIALFDPATGSQQSSLLLNPTNAVLDKPLLKDLTWQAFTLFNGWTGAAAPNVPFYRMMPDGTVQFTGLITKASAPVSGEKVLSVAAGYFPVGTSAFSAHSNLTVTGNQKIFVDNTGAGLIWDPTTGNGSAYLSEIRYPTSVLP